MVVYDCHVSSDAGSGHTLPFHPLFPLQIPSHQRGKGSPEKGRVLVFSGLTVTVSVLEGLRLDEAGGAMMKYCSTSLQTPPIKEADLPIVPFLRHG